MVWFWYFGANTKREENFEEDMVMCVNAPKIRLKEPNNIDNQEAICFLTMKLQWHSRDVSSE